MAQKRSYETPKILKARLGLQAVTAQESPSLPPQNNAAN